jgi:mRNA-degrading endonuclease RelE of RelBE toxin-antitoxin system
MSYEIYLGHQAKKEMAKIDRSLARRLRDRLRELAVNPLDPRLARKWKRTRTGVILGWG